MSQDKAADKTLPEERIWQFLKGKGLSDYAAAGIMGNLYAESGLIPTNLEDYYECKLGMSDDEYTCAVDAGEYPNFVHDRAGYGLAQWTYYSRKAGLLKYARAKGKSIGDLDMQLEFLWQELQLNQSLMDKLAEAGSVQEASNAVLFDFERPADQSEAVQSIRAGYGQDYYDDFALTNKLVMEEEESMRYNNVAEVPEWAQPTIQKMIDKGLLGGTSGKDNLDLTLEMIRVFVVNDRAGLY
nr:phage tail tip lysozyme [Selenomonas ruminantium]